MAADSLPPLSASQAFWRVEVPCGVPKCSSSVIAHMQTFGQTSRHKLGLMIAKASPAPACESGHAPSPDSSYPERVDFVEWMGGEGYLT